MEVWQRILELSRTGLERQPTLSLILMASVVAVFLAALRERNPQPPVSLAGTIYRHVCRLLWAGLLVGLVGAAAVGWQSYLGRTLADYRHSHGRLTEVNLDAVRTIWGDEQVQGELQVQLWWEEEQIERIESEDLSKPTVTRKKTIRNQVPANPFLSTRHEVTLRQNARKKGSGIYAGYETENQFQWLLHNPADRPVQGTLRFPLPSRSAMFNDLAVTINDTNVLHRLRVENGALVLELPFAPNETVDARIKFKSRGLTHWYFQVREAREVRDFELRVNLPDLLPAKLNYPEGCMTPTEIQPTGAGSVLVYRLDRAICNKGMGIAMPALTQPGETTSAVLAQAGRGWVLVFAALVLGLTLAGQPHAALISVLLGSGAALAYGLTGDVSDSPLGFWGSAGVVLLPTLLLLGWLASKLTTRWIMVQCVVFGAVYPCLAGLDDARQSLYLNGCAGILLVAVVVALRQELTSRARA
ncbi:MAG: hypothetical protein PCFJNLEI_00763 [Verrucomicrobiae bacterium]|nr:hypothetical protein [Verrucomicrobiae bacterium]